MWTSESNFRECVLSVRYVGPRNQTQVVRLGNQHACQWSHLTVLQVGLKGMLTDALLLGS